MKKTLKKWWKNPFIRWIVLTPLAISIALLIIPLVVALGMVMIKLVVVLAAIIVAWFLIILINLL
jgi:hypothetical protein